MDLHNLSFSILYHNMPQNESNIFEFHRTLDVPTFFYRHFVQPTFGTERENDDLRGHIRFLT
jgi:hypothetical protein